MGSWGYLPNHNDGSADLWYCAELQLVAGLCELFGTKLTRNGKRWGSGSDSLRSLQQHYKALRHPRSTAHARERQLHGMWERVGVVYSALSRGIPVPNEIIKICCTDIDTLLGEKAFIDTWFQPTKMRKACELVKRQLSELLELDYLGTESSVGWECWPKSNAAKKKMLERIERRKSRRPRRRTRRKGRKAKARS